MTTSIDSLIGLAKIFGSSVDLRKDVNDAYLVYIPRVSYKESYRDIMSRSISGRGATLEAACHNYLLYAKGKILFADDKSYYGDKRIEYVCV